ncbi:hypothetical protein GCM10022198_25180 [Klugiella xanthotipulae]|uniref:Putative GNAT superfamily acetyltransferase n=1 Tax=Klugiella xanthotipulae TaxID=244735 RepID=A0A543HZ39_9MICO|nr:hypothetical protein [Klugiella xanthotipulae]TQM63591.1 putative GNAT superfamily acetyltransferase [Klugiella xanthotipulae]
MHGIISNAYELAQVAAEQAGVRVHLAQPHDYSPIVQLFCRTWGERRVPDAALVQAIGYAGNTVIVAEREDGSTVGGVLGFLGWDEGLHAHSYMAAVAEEVVSLGIGRAMKLFQRAVCMDQGIAEIRWTYDPLVQRNAHLNLVRLGAEVARFLPNFYGVLNDEISGDDVTDCFEVRWRLNSQRVRRALAGNPPAEPVGSVGLELVRDFETLRRESPTEAARLRAESQGVFVAAFAAGLRPFLDAAGNYVFVHPEDSIEPPPSVGV